eukprot:259831-Amphidinium_carterae.2
MSCCIDHSQRTWLARCVMLPQPLFACSLLEILVFDGSKNFPGSGGSKVACMLLVVIVAHEGFSSPSSWPLAAYSTLHQRTWFSLFCEVGSNVGGDCSVGFVRASLVHSIGPTPFHKFWLLAFSVVFGNDPNLNPSPQADNRIIGCTQSRDLQNSGKGPAKS